jgi:hypothetical protein
LVIQGQERSEEVNEEQLRAYQDWPKPGSLRLIDFERTEIVTLESFPPQFVLRVAGTKPFLNMEVELVPLVFIQQPEYWGIEVVGRLRSGIGLPVVTPYDVSIPLMGITGTRGVEVIGATRSERIEIPPTEVPPTDCRDWSAWHDHQPPGPPTLHVRGECEFPTAGFSVELRRHEPQGINPKDLLLDLIVNKPSGLVSQVITVEEVRYDEVTDFEYDTVTILPDGPSIDVQDVH